MSYRKLKADFLFDGFNMHQNAVLICRQDGTIEAIVDENLAGGDLENYPGLLTPGFINSHCHLELSHLKNRTPEKQGLVPFVLSVINQRDQDPLFIQEAARIAEQDMLSAGIVAVGDICNTIDTGNIKSAKRLAYYNFIELLGWIPGLAESRYSAAKSLEARFIKMGQDEKYMSLNPHAPYSVSSGLWNLMEPDFRDKTITIHNQETTEENEFFISGTGELTHMYAGMKIDNSHFKPPGTRSLPYYLSRLKSAARQVLVHNTYMDESDLKEALDFSKNLFFCFCPNANIFIENRLPAIPLFIKYRDRLLLGTDSLASNRHLSILEEMKTIKKNFPSIPTTEMLLWGTSNGAKALSFDDRLGEFTKGKKPGIVLLENLNEGEISILTTARRII